MVMRNKFSFLYIDILFHVSKCEFILNKKYFKMLIVFSPIFMADAKIKFRIQFRSSFKRTLYILSILTIAPNGHADAKRKILVKLKILKNVF